MIKLAVAIVRAKTGASVEVYLLFITIKIIVLTAVPARRLNHLRFRTGVSSIAVSAFWLSVAITGDVGSVTWSATCMLFERLNGMLKTAQYTASAVAAILTVAIEALVAFTSGITKFIACEGAQEEAKSTSSANRELFIT